eukprot:SAG11_NODE_22852_length_399_cov_0.676667_1_plen_72_part_01
MPIGSLCLRLCNCTSTPVPALGLAPAPASVSSPHDEAIWMRSVLRFYEIEKALLHGWWSDLDAVEPDGKIHR